MLIPKSLQNLITEFEKLPTIGPKSASRLAFSLMNSGEGKNLSEAIKDAYENLRKCDLCFNISEEEFCEVCKNSSRNKARICVVEDSLDVIAIERMNRYDGVYHVLGGLISPMDDVEELTLKQLLKRIENLAVECDRVETILAINQSIEGEITSMYIKDHINKLENTEKVELTRLASG